MALLRAVRHKGGAFLQSVEFGSLVQSSYEKTFVLLDDHYSKEETIFVLVSQTAKWRWERLSCEFVVTQVKMLVTHLHWEGNFPKCYLSMVL